MLITFQYCFHCSGVMIIVTEFSRTWQQMAAISANSSLVAASDVVGATLVPSRTALDAGAFAQYPKSWNSSPLQMGASPASVCHYFSWISKKIVLSTESRVVCSTIDPHSPSTCSKVALRVRSFPVTKFCFRQKLRCCSRCMMELIFWNASLSSYSCAIRNLLLRCFLQKRWPCSW